MAKTPAVKQLDKSQKGKGRGKGRPFKPGQSGNPNGRPKKEFALPFMLKESSELPASDDPNEQRTRMQAVIDFAWIQAMSGNKDARQWISDRMEGRPWQAIEVTNIDPDTISIINYDDE